MVDGIIVMGLLSVIPGVYMVYVTLKLLGEKLGIIDVKVPTDILNAVVVKEPPSNLTPIEVGILFDGVVDWLDIGAAIIDLNIQGYIDIEYTRKKSILGTEEYDIVFIKKNKASLDNPVYKSLLDLLFQDGEKITDSELRKKRQKINTEIRIIQNGALEFLYKKGYFELISKKINWWYRMVIALTYVVFIIVAVMRGFGVMSSQGGVGDFAIFLTVVVSIVRAIYPQIPPRLTEEGKNILQKIRGFRKFLKYPQETIPSMQLAIQYVPYVLIFGISNEWIMKSEDSIPEMKFKMRQWKQVADFICSLELPRKVFIGGSGGRGRGIGGGSSGGGGASGSW